MKAPDLKNLIGENIGILSRSISPQAPLFQARLHGVESSGLWLESTQLTEIMLQSLHQQTFEATPVFFFPFHMIECVIWLLDSPAISETIAE